MIRESQKLRTIVYNTEVFCKKDSLAAIVNCKALEISLGSCFVMYCGCSKAGGLVFLYL